jgi:hypothetical protein
MILDLGHRGVTVGTVRIDGTVLEHGVVGGAITVNIACCVAVGARHAFLKVDIADAQVSFGLLAAVTIQANRWLVNGTGSGQITVTV